MDNNKKKKRILTGVIIAIVLVGVVGVTYALWSYFQISKNQQLVAGEIYMKYTETSNTINIQDAMPSKTYGDDYFQFTIEGKNTYTKPIWYEIVINWGEEPEGRSVRIPDEFLRFRLTEQLPGEEEKEVIANGKYSDFSKGKKIWVNKIDAKSPETTITYKLYMWISDEMVLGSGDAASTSDMDMETWNNDAFASVKVTVNGDFEEKELDKELEPVEVPVSCFEYEILDKTYLYNTERTEENIVACVNYMTEFDKWGYYFNNEDHTARAFCEGTGTDKNNYKLEDYIYNYGEETRQALLQTGILKTIPRSEVMITQYKNSNEECGTNIIIPEEIEGHKVTIIGTGDELYGNNSQYIKPIAYWEEPDYISSFSKKNLTSVILPSSLKIIGDHAFYDNKLANIDIPSGVTTIGSSAFSGNQLTSVNIPNNVTEISSSAFSGNQLTSVNIPNNVTEISSYAFYNNQLTSVNIPNSVKTIDSEAFYNNKLANIDIPSGVTTINYYAFSNNQLTSVDIPNSVRTIGGSAFSGNQLTEVTIGNGIQYIGYEAFEKSTEESLSNPNLSKITIDKTCTEIKNIEEPPGDYSSNTKYYPWLQNEDHYNPPYSAPGVTIYGSGGEVCDTF